MIKGNDQNVPLSSNCPNLIQIFLKYDIAGLIFLGDTMYLIILGHPLKIKIVVQCWTMKSATQNLNHLDFNLLPLFKLTFPDIKMRERGLIKSLDFLLKKIKVKIQKK